MHSFNNHPYVNYIPEIITGWNDKRIYVFLEQNVKVGKFGPVESNFILDFVMYKLVCLFGGYKRVYKDEEDRSFMRAGYFNVVINLTTHQLFSGLYEILKGNTKYISHLPNPLEFQEVCKNAPKFPSEKEVTLLEYSHYQENTLSEEQVRGNIRKMKKMLFEMEQQEKVEKEEALRIKKERLKKSLSELNKRQGEE